MIEELKKLEVLSRKLDDPSRILEDMDLLKSFSKDFLANTANGPGVLNGESKPEIAPPSQGARPTDQVLKRLEEIILRRGLNATSGKFMGYIPGGGLPHSAMGDFLAALTNRYAGVYEAGPGAAAIENEMVSWLARRLKMPESAFGSLTSGGTTAILLCLVAARSRLKFEDWSRSVIYFSAETHHCLQRSLIVAGLSVVKQRSIATLDGFRIDTEALLHQISRDRRDGLNPWLVVGNAGTVNTGAVDDLECLADLSRKESVWFHVDACYGGGFAMLPECAALFRGIEKADSVALDPHKGFFQPYGIGACLVREASILKQELSYTADYLADVYNDSERSPADYSIELTRHFRGLRFWFSLNCQGLEAIEACQREKLLLAQYLYTRLLEWNALHLGPRPSLSTVAFRLKNQTDDKQKRMLEKLVAAGFLVSSTRLNGELFLRACILGFRSHKEDVDAMIAFLASYVS